MNDEFLQPWRKPAPLHADEHPNSMVVRMARYGGMSVSDFRSNYLAQVRGAPDVGYDAKALRRLALIASHDLNALMASSLLPDASSRDRQLPEQTPYKRVAPGMLRSDGPEPYVRRSWSFWAFPCDLVTGEVLLKHCPKCRATLRWDAERIETCGSCLFDLRDHPEVYWPSAEVSDMQVIARGLGYRVMGKGTDAEIDLPAPFGALEPDEKIAALAWCARLRGLIDRSHISAATTSAYLGLPIARSWPKPIWQLANLLTRQEDADMLQAYSAIQFHLRHRLPAPISSAVVTEISKALYFARSKVGRRVSARPYRPYLGFRVRKVPTVEDQKA